MIPAILAEKVFFSSSIAHRLYRARGVLGLKDDDSCRPVSGDAVCTVIMIVQFLQNLRKGTADLIHLLGAKQNILRDC